MKAAGKPGLLDQPRAVAVEHAGQHQQRGIVHQSAEQLALVVGGSRCRRVHRVLQFIVSTSCPMPMTTLPWASRLASQPGGTTIVVSYSWISSGPARGASAQRLPRHHGRVELARAPGRSRPTRARLGASAFRRPVGAVLDRARHPHDQPHRDELERLGVAAMPVGALEFLLEALLDRAQRRDVEQLLRASAPSTPTTGRDSADRRTARIRPWLGIEAFLAHAARAGRCAFRPAPRRRVPGRRRRPCPSAPCAPRDARLPRATDPAR